MITALIGFSTVVFIALKGKGFFKIIPFLIGIVTAYLFAAIVGLVDFTEFVTVISHPSLWFKLPEFMFLGFKNGSTHLLGSDITFYKANFTAVATIAPLAFVTAAEHIGDHTVLSKVCGEDFLQDPGLDKTIMGDGLATMFAAIIGGPANTTYGENTSVVGMTKVASVWVTGGAAVIAIILSFFNVFTTLIATIPASVMGGISIILYGFIASNGLKVMIEKKVDMGNLRNLIIVASMLVIGLGGSVLTFGTFQVYGMSLAAIVGVILNFVLPKKDKVEVVL